MTSQNDAVLSHLKSGASLTPLDALHKYGILRLAARVRNLRECGYRIETVTRRNKLKHWAEYRMPEHYTLPPRMTITDTEGITSVYVNGEKVKLPFECSTDDKITVDIETNAGNLKLKEVVKGGI